tara:strand:+ start:26 stop:442 length:417 start_codon:yes stop_codon:yes gene_type:complete
MKKNNYLTKSYEDTMKLGIDFSKNLKNKDIVGLIGDLAAGKTTFVKGVLKGLGYEYTVSSPTFTLINNYEAKIEVMHVDFYREPNIQRWIELGFKELIYSNGIVLIEWADLIPELIPSEAIMIKFEHINQNERKIYML